MELSRADRDQAIASIQRYFKANMNEPCDAIGNIAAGALLGFFMEEIGPLLYNQGMADTQAHLLAKVAEVDIDVNEAAFGYWNKFKAKR